VPPGYSAVTRGSASRAALSVPRGVPGSGVRLLTAWRAVPDAAARSPWSLAGWGIVLFSFQGGSRAGFRLGFDVVADPLDSVGEGEGEPGGLAGLGSAHTAGLGQRGDDRQTPAALLVRAGFQAPGLGRRGIADLAGDAAAPVGFDVAAQCEVD